jgi:hypothetical protein
VSRVPHRPSRGPCGGCVVIDHRSERTDAKRWRGRRRRRGAGEGAARRSERFRYNGGNAGAALISAEGCITYYQPRRRTC